MCRRGILCGAVVTESIKIPRKIFSIFVEFEGMYRNMVEQLTTFAVGSDIRSFVRLKAMKYRDARDLYPHLPSRYAYTAYQDASTRSKSFLRLKEERKVMGKLKERTVKREIRLKIANIVVRTAYEKGYGIALERLRKNVAKNIATEIDDDQPRQRIHQTTLRGIQKAIIEKTREYRAPATLTKPKDSSSKYPFHDAATEHEKGSRIRRCAEGKEKWHRDLTRCRNNLLRAFTGLEHCSHCRHDLDLDGSLVPLGSTATHEPTKIKKSLWARWKSPEGLE